MALDNLLFLLRRWIFLLKDKIFYEKNVFFYLQKKLSIYMINEIKIMNDFIKNDIILFYN